MADNKKLAIKYFPASELVTFPGNPRKVKDPDAVKKLTKLIEAHGFQNPLQIWQHEGVNYILCGNHRFKAACDLVILSSPVSFTPVRKRRHWQGLSVIISRVNTRSLTSLSSKVLLLTLTLVT